jgi:MoaA/NifB/PqqE/SkfB family radical SAM enzyme
MYFSVFGKAGPCWLQVNVTTEWGNGKTIKDIWQGPEFNKIREDLLNDKYCGKCKICKTDWDNGVWPLAHAYDKFGVQNYPEYPTVFELELSNQCNLECQMCSGALSSGIRKNREHKPPLPMMYDQSFVDQLTEYVPHLEEMRFNGGEPFAQKIVLNICDMVAKINPSLKINIATNGTVYNKRVQKILNQNNIHLNISIDSLIKQRYEDIRVNANYDELMTNFKIFHKYSVDGDRDLAIMVNPMRNNWEEMVDFLEFADNHNANLWYNTIRYPAHLALWNLKSDQLKQIYTTLSEKLEKYNISIDNKYMKKRNYSTTKHLIEQQIKTWLLDSYAR